jgi:hypothetical protein
MPNKALQPTATPPLCSAAPAAELGRWIMSGLDLVIEEIASYEYQETTCTGP